MSSLAPSSQSQLAVEALLARYAEALNAADAAQLPAFYTPDGVFLPDGTAALPTEKIKARSVSFFAKARFRIRYAVQTVAIDGPYAFVHATAQTSTTDVATHHETHRTSRDFFVLRQQAAGDWKIYRYFLNYVRPR